MKLYTVTQYRSTWHLWHFEGHLLKVQHQRQSWRNSTCDCSKIYRITLFVCAPYFVTLNNNTVQLKTLLFLFINVHTKREQKKSSPVIKFTVLPFRHCYVESSNHINVQKVRLQHQYKPTDNDVHSSMSWLTTDWSIKQLHIYYVVSNTFFK